jgi:tRNA-specific 2-thiouridylase
MVAMSGGIDSAVAALLLVRQGFAVEGLFMKNWEEDDRAGHCRAAEDLEDLRRVCERLEIPLRTANFSDAYWARVFEHFLHEYRAGRTPNPDVLCNREIKFRVFLEHALNLGAEQIATGHYARISTDDEGHHLRIPKDRCKDQTYFLHLLGQRELAKTLFPLADLTKASVRELGAEARLPNHGKRDSTGICFIGERKFREFLSRYAPAQPGAIETCDGRRIGTHDGVLYYTLGQRQGLGIGGQRHTSGKPWYVVDKDLKHNVLIVVQGHEHPLLFRSRLRAASVHWILGRTPPSPLACSAKIRYRQSLQRCTVHDLGDGGLDVEFEQPQRAVTPGQSVVFYRDGECLGGGTITSTPETRRSGSGNAGTHLREPPRDPSPPAATE